MSRTYTIEAYRRDLARLDALRSSAAPGLRETLAAAVIADADLSAPPESGVVQRRRDTAPGGFVAAPAAVVLPANTATWRAAGLGPRPRTTLRCHWLALALAVVAVLLGSGCGQAPSSAGLYADALEYRIDPAFTPEQAGMIRVGIAFWEAELPGVDIIELDAPAGGCEPGGRGDSRHCFVAMPEGCDALTAPDDTFAGRHFPAGWIAVLDSLEGERMAVVAAHEFGHRLGLTHTSVGVMAKSVGEARDWRLSPKAVRLFESRGWR